jgi:hypothetical protein
MTTLTTLGSQLSALAPYLNTAAGDVLGDRYEDSTYAELLGGSLLALIMGFELHGSGLFTMSDDRLAVEYRRELEDAIVYRAEMLRREHAANGSGVTDGC